VEKAAAIAGFTCGYDGCRVPLFLFVLELSRPLQLLLPLTLVRMISVDLVELMFFQHFVPTRSAERMKGAAPVAFVAAEVRGQGYFITSADAGPCDS
jgi:hypothetical protein